jgi:hypothetical protein
MAAAHGLAVVWLASQASILKFRADPVADRSAVLVELTSLPSAASHPRAVAVPHVETPLPAQAPTPSGPATIDQGTGLEDDSNLARPVFLDWPHPVPPGVNWGRAPDRVALSGGWSYCRHDPDKDQQAWAPPDQVKPPCLAP